MREPKRLRPFAHAAIDNGPARTRPLIVPLIAASRALVVRLPNGKLPGCNDFCRYGEGHAVRIWDRERAIARCERFADESMRWLEKPIVGP